LLFTVGWGPHYFKEVLGIGSPIPGPTVLSTFERPVLDNYDVCIHLACDDEARLVAVAAALLHGRALPGVAGALRITDPLRWRETRAGFVGTGLPAQHQDVPGVPAGDPGKRDSAVRWDAAAGAEPLTASESAPSGEVGARPEMLVPSVERVSEEADRGAG